MDESRGGTMWIIGGSGDIGRAMGKEFGTRGWKVCLSARTRSRLEDARNELVADGIETGVVRLDAAERADVRRGVSEFVDMFERPSVLVYNVSPQSSSNDHRFTSYLRHSAIGLATVLEALDAAARLPEHVVVPTSSKGRDPSAVSPDYHGAKQALIAYLEAFCTERDTTYSVLWLGRRGTEAEWRWLRPEEMAAKAWESLETRESELLVGDLY